MDTFCNCVSADHGCGLPTCFYFTVKAEHDALCSCQPCMQKQADQRQALKDSNPPSESVYTPHSWELGDYEPPAFHPSDLEEEDVLTKWSRADEQATYAEWMRAEDIMPAEQEYLEGKFKMALRAFYDAEYEGYPVSLEINAECHRAEGALLLFLQKTMSEEAALLYVGDISWELDS